MHQHDARHVDVLVKDVGLERGNSVQPPAVHDVTHEEPEPVDQMQSSKNRSQVARCLFCTQDRAVTFIRNELCHRMSTPHTAEPYKVEQTGQIPKKGKAVETDLQLRKNGRRNVMLGRLQRNTDIINCGRDTARQSHVESIHTQTWCPPCFLPPYHQVPNPKRDIIQIKRKP